MTETQVLARLVEQSLVVTRRGPLLRWVSEMGVKRFGGKMMVERSRVQSQNTEDLVLV